MSNSLVLSLGDVHHLRLGKDRIVYAGMPSENIFSIVHNFQFPLLTFGDLWYSF